MMRAPEKSDVRVDALRALDVCCGAGGLSIGLSRAGFSVSGVDDLPVAVETYRRHAPATLADIRTWCPEGPVDLVAGGVPCQPFSAAGRQGGFCDDRGRLYLDLIRIASEASARCVLLENVPGLRSNQVAMREIVRAMQAAGFVVDGPVVLDAADHGVPQHRRRLFLLGVRGRVRWNGWPSTTHGSPGLPPWKTVRDAVGLPVDKPCATILATEYKGASLSDLTRRQGARKASGWIARQMHEAGLVPQMRLTLEQCAALQGFPPGMVFSGSLKDQYVLVGNAVPPPLAAAVGGSIHEALSEPP